MPTLYCFPVSQPSRSCMWFADYAGLKDIEVKVVDIMKGEHKAPEFLAKFPKGQVPAFEDGDLCFAESTAILPYIADGNPLMPTAKKDLARLQEYFGTHVSEARKFTTDFLRPVLFAKSAEEVAEISGPALASIAPILAKFDALLGKQQYVLGDALSLADFLFAPEVDQLALCVPTVFDKYPNVAKYLERLRSDVPGYAKSIDSTAAIVKGLTDARGF